MRFFNKIQLEEQTRYLHYLDTRITTATSLHRHMNVFSISCVGEHLTHRVQHIILSCRRENKTLIVDIQPLSLQALLPPRHVIFPSGTAKNKHPIPEEKRQHIYSSYKASLCMCAACYGGELFQLDSLIVSLGFDDTRCITKTVREESQTITQNLSTYVETYCQRTTL